MVTALAGPRRSNGLRPFYSLLGAGVGITTWSGAAYNPGSKAVRHALDLGPTVFIAQGGFGSEFNAFGANRIELRLNITTPATSYRSPAYTINQPGGGFNLTIRPRLVATRRTG